MGKHVRSFKVLMGITSLTLTSLCRLFEKKIKLVSHRKRLFFEAIQKIKTKWKMLVWGRAKTYQNC